VLKIYGWEIISQRKRFKRCFWRTPFIFLQMRQLIQEVLFNDTFLFTFQMQSLFDASIRGVPHFVYTDHTHLVNLTYPDFDQSNLYNQGWIDLERTIYSNASLIFVRSSNIVASLISDYYCSSSKVVCAYAGSNAVDQVAELSRAKYENKHILFVGIDWERKGGQDLIEAFELVRQVHSDALLTIVGCWPQIDSPNCRVIGRVPVDAVAKYFQEASVFCLPTHLEPFGVVFVEAMASRLPIVATNVGAIPDFVHDGVSGFLVKPRDVQGIADALITLISDPHKAREFGEKGYKLAQHRYSWKAVGNLMRKHILETIVNK
jgi:glycosyltransferase involved in cell wall biosynthesis